MRYQKTSLALAAIAVCGSLPLAAQAQWSKTTGSSSAPTLEFQAPAAGGALRSGVIQGPPECTVTGDNLARVMFYLNGAWLNTDGRASNGFGCWLDTRDFADGAYTLRAVAYNAAGESTTVEHPVRIANGTTGGNGGGTGGKDSGTSGSAPTLSFQTPAPNGTLKSGVIQGPPDCTVTGSNLARVMFYLNGSWLNTDGNAANGFGCWLDTRKFSDGAYTLRAVAYNAAGESTTVEHPVRIANGTTGGNDGGTGGNGGGTSGSAPTLSFQAPAPGGTLKSGVIQGPPDCTVTGTNLARVMFYLNDLWLNTDGNASNGFGCWLDTRNFADGSYTLKAVAYNAAGESITVNHPVAIKNGSTSGDSGGNSGGSAGAVSSADVMQLASGYVPFAEQSGYNAQVVGTFPHVSSIPESGIHHSRMSNGETLRLGKENDPAGSGKKALAFQLAPGDPITSGSRRAEIRFADNIEHNKVYWVAFRMYVRDWGSLSSSDAAVFGTQLHSGDNSRGLSPSFSLVTYGGRTFQVYALHSTSSSPSQGNTVTTKSSNINIPFGRWVDMVFRFKQNTAGSGFLQAWMDGQQVMNYQGRLGFNTPGYKDYMKFGYYNWSSFGSPRKVMLREASLVLDPTGSKYRQEDLRAFVNK